jgi:PAS domain-containing protein
MKWQVNRVSSSLVNEKMKTYLCAGYNLLETGRVEAMNELGEKNYQMIVEGLSAGILFQDRNGELISANQKTAEIFNTTLERLYELKI